MCTWSGSATADGIVDACLITALIDSMRRPIFHNTGPTGDFAVSLLPLVILLSSQRIQLPVHRLLYAQPPSHAVAPALPTNMPLGK